MQLAVQAVLDLVDCARGVVGIGEVDLDVILGSRFPRAVFRERMARAGDHAPTGGGKPLDGRMPDPTAGSGQQQGAARLVCEVGIGLRIEPRLGPGRARVAAGERDPVMQAERPILPELDRQRDTR